MFHDGFAGCLLCRSPKSAARSGASWSVQSTEHGHGESQPAFVKHSGLLLLQRRPRQLQLAAISTSGLLLRRGSHEFDWRLSWIPVSLLQRRFASNSTRAVRDSALSKTQRCSPSSATQINSTGFDRDSALLLLQRHSIEFDSRCQRLSVATPPARFAMSSAGVCLGFRLHSSGAVRIESNKRRQGLSAVTASAPLHRIQPAFQGVLGVLFPAPFTLASTGVSPRSWRYTPSATPLRFSSAGRGLMDRLTK